MRTLILSLLTYPALLLPVVPASAQGKPDVVFTTAEALMREIAADRTAAKQKYPAFTPIVVQGVVKSLDKNKQNEPLVLLKGHTKRYLVHCSFAAGEVAQAKQIKVGQKITVAGAVVGMFDAELMLTACSLLPAETPIPPLDAELVPKLKLDFGKKVTGLVTFKHPARDEKTVLAVPNLAYIADQEFGIVKLPKEMMGTQALIRDKNVTALWPAGNDYQIMKPTTVYVAMIVKTKGKEIINENKIAAFESDDWTLVKEPFETSHPKDESWTWVVLKKDLAAGDLAVSPPRVFSSWPAPQTVFFFRERIGAATTTAPARPTTPEKVKITFGKKVEGLITHSGARDGWRVVEAVPNLAYMMDRETAITKLPREMQGGHLLQRDSGRSSQWIQEGQLTAVKDGTLYAAIRHLTDKQAAAMETEDWERVEEPFTVSGEPAHWLVFRRAVKAGDDNFPLPRNFQFFNTPVVYVMKAEK